MQEVDVECVQDAAPPTILSQEESWVVGLGGVGQ